MNKEHFEKLCEKAGLKPQGKYDTPYGTVLVAEAYRNDKPQEYSFGYYKTMWAVERGDMDIGHDLEFDAFHDPHLPVHEKRRARINTTVQHAAGWMHQNADSGRYDK